MLALGIAFLLGGLRYHEQRFNATAARAYSTMMFLAAVSMTVPSAFSRVFAPNEVIRQEQLLNIGIAVLLLIAYGALHPVFTANAHVFLRQCRIRESRSSRRAMVRSRAR